MGVKCPCPPVHKDNSKVILQISVCLPISFRLFVKMPMHATYQNTRYQKDSNLFRILPSVGTTDRSRYKPSLVFAGLAAFPIPIHLFKVAGPNTVTALPFFLQIILSNFTSLESLAFKLSSVRFIFLILLMV